MWFGGDLGLTWQVDVILSQTQILGVKNVVWGVSTDPMTRPPGK